MCARARETERSCQKRRLGCQLRPLFCSLSLTQKHLAFLSRDCSHSATTYLFLCSQDRRAWNPGDSWSRCTSGGPSTCHTFYTFYLFTFISHAIDHSVISLLRTPRQQYTREIERKTRKTRLLHFVIADDARGGQLTRAHARTYSRAAHHLSFEYVFQWREGAHEQRTPHPTNAQHGGR